jgi:hypothetical protein
MGTLDQGFLGGFSGTVGPAVGSRWKRKNILRARPPRKRGKSSELQLVNQAKFKVMNKFLRPITDLLNQTYRKSALGMMSGFNRAFSDNSLRGAVIGEYPAYAIDYSRILLSKGSLANADEPSAVSNETGKLVFNWTDNSGINQALSSDGAFVAVYLEEKNHWVYKGNIAMRNAGTCTLEVASFKGKPVQTYIGFMSADGNRTSESLYIGLVNVL